MNNQNTFSRFLFAVGLGMLAAGGLSQSASAEDYKIINSSKTMGTGGIDYVYADNDGRRLYVPRGGQILRSRAAKTMPAMPASATAIADLAMSDIGMCVKD